MSNYDTIDDWIKIHTDGTCDLKAHKEAVTIYNKSKKVKNDE